MKNPQTINGEYYYDTWYEIFVTRESGETRTIESVSTFEEIDNTILRLEEQHPDLKGKLSADRWGTLDDEGWDFVQID